MTSLKCIVVDGPRGAGKTTLINELCSRYPKMLYPVKFPFGVLRLTATSNPELTVPIQLEHLALFVKQMPRWPMPVIDRLVGTEIVMSRLHNRPLNENLMYEMDELWSHLALQVILMCDPDVGLKRSNRESEGDPHFVALAWGQFLERTKMPTALINSTEMAPRDILVSLINTMPGFDIPILSTMTGLN